MIDETVASAVEEWKGAAFLNKQLPIRFEDGTQLRQLAVDCARCGKRVQASNLKGSIHKPLPDRYRITGLAACAPCQAFTKFSFLCSGSKGKVTLEWHANGERLRHTETVSWWTRVLSKFL